MFKNLARNIAAVLILTLTALATPAIHASTSTDATASTPTVSTSPAVTGGDPEPTSPDVIQMILILIHLA